LKESIIMHNNILLTGQIGYFANLIRLYGYYVLFLLVIIEGPATIFISGFLTSLGLLNPVITYIVIVVADLFGDILYYSAGRWWIKKASNKVLDFFKISTKNFEKFKQNFHKHKGKIMFFGKLSSFLGGFIMYLAGLSDVPFLPFIYINGFGALFKTLLLLISGYFFGATILQLSSGFDLISTIALIVLSLLIFGLYAGITSFSNRYLQKEEK